MARKSRWMQFTENFNAMKGTLDDAFKQYDINQVGKQPFEDEEGNALTGNALARAKNDALAGVYEKWGDAEGALNLRTKGAELEGLMRANRIGDATEEHKIYTQGEGARAKLDSGIAANNAAAAASNATTTLRDLEAGALRLKAEQTEELNNIFTTMGGQEFKSQADEDAYLINQLKASSLPPAMRTSAIEAVRKFGSEAIAMETDRITAAARDALKGGLPTFVGFYNDQVADGFQLEISPPGEDGVTKAYAVRMDADGNPVRSEIAMGAGEGANMQILNTLYQQVRDPGNVLGAAVDNLAYRKSQAGLGKTAAETKNIESETSYREGPQTDLTEKKIEEITSQNAARGSKVKLNDAQIELIAEKIAASEFNRNPERPMTTKEVQEELSGLMAGMAASGLYDNEEMEAAKDLFLANIGLDDFTVERIK